jgi:hypothetical protein
MARRFIGFSSVVLVCFTLMTDAYAVCSFGVQGTRSYFRNAIERPQNCAGEAKAAIQKNLETILNVDYVTGSYGKSQMESLSGQYGAGGYGGSYGKTQTSSGSSAITMGDTRWIVTVDSCRAYNVSAAAGRDRGWGRGRGNNGHCSADVRCEWRFTTYDFNCP